MRLLARKGRFWPSLFFLMLAFPLFSQAEEALSGPLYGKNLYLPHLPVYSFPGMSPRSGVKGRSRLSVAYTCINEFVAYDMETAALDYESSLLEAGYSYRPADNLVLTADLRIISYYGGFFDSAIEEFHGLFGFPNGGRGLFDRNRLRINLDNLYGRDISLGNSVLYPGDTDLSGVWTFRENPDFVLAAAGSLKLPTGRLEYATGSGYADLGIQILGEWLFHPLWVLEFQQGVVLPGDWFCSLFTGGETYASQLVSQTTLALGFAPGEEWRILAQARINTSPIRSDRERTYSTLGTIDLFTLPQTAFLLGFKKNMKPWVLQVYFEEDPFTYEGADILLSMRVSRFL